MSDFFEIDFLDVEVKKSGDAICLRYELAGTQYIHVVDGGYKSTGDLVVEHIKQHYGSPTHINHVVATHNDGDHAPGLQAVLDNFTVGKLWMLRPWMYANELLPHFSNYSNVDNLRKRLRDIYSNLAELEDIAIKKGIPIGDPFQGELIGAFTVMAPTKPRFLQLVIDSEKTPATASIGGMLTQAFDTVGTLVKEAAGLVKAAWGVEYFPDGDTSAENEMSVVQYAALNNQKILLTGDTGRAGLQEVIDYAPYVGLTLPGIDRFQCPHHGGRHNVNTELLDKLLGKCRPQQGLPPTFYSVISSAEADANHPRKSVKRALIHRGAEVYTTEGKTVCLPAGIARPGWSRLDAEPYPDEQED